MSFKKKLMLCTLTALGVVLAVWSMSVLLFDNNGSYNNTTQADNFMKVFSGDMTADYDRLLLKLAASPEPDITVDDDIEDDPVNHTWNTIQEGIDDASEGDVIYVRSGTYRENIVIYKQLTLMGEDNSNTIIDGGSIGDAVHIRAKNVRVSGFKIINGKSMLYKPVEIRGEAAGGSATWTEQNFGGFYHDIDSSAGNETLKAVVSGREIRRGNLTYTTAPQEVRFAYSPFGRYEVMGFMGEKFFAGYTSNSGISGNRTISSLEKGQLHKVLLDDRDKHTVLEDGTLNLKEGYALRLKPIDAVSGEIQMVLLKDGNEVGHFVALERNNTYVYSKKVGNISDLPVIAVHVDSVLREANTAIISGIFQISETYTHLAAGERFGNRDYIPAGEEFVYLFAAEVSAKGIILKNDMQTIHLTRNSEIEIAGGLKIKVADSDTLRFYPAFERTDSDLSEIRGRSAKGAEAQAWDADSFSGFYYNPDEDIKPEKLEISGISGRSIGKGDLTYQTMIAPAYFNIYKQKGILINGQANYSVIGLGGETYAAVGGKANKIARILIDHGKDDIKTIMVPDEPWEMGEGYNLTVLAIDTGSPRKAQLLLTRNGIKLDEKWLSNGEAYTYTDPNRMEETGLPVFVTYLEAVFTGIAYDGSIQLRYTWLLSRDAVEIKSGDIFNSLEVVNVTSEKLTFKNHRAISLDQGSTIPLIRDIIFRVADSPELRYYPALTRRTGRENSAGIAIDEADNSIIAYNNILNSFYGIRLNSTKNILLAGNNVSNSGYGIYLYSSGRNILINNSMADNLYNFGVSGHGSDFNNRIDADNLVDGKPVYYMKGSTDDVFDASNIAGTFYCIDCVNITVRDMELSDNSAGIFFWNTTGSKIQNITASHNYYGIQLMSSSGNMLINNTVSNEISLNISNKIMHQDLYFMLPQNPGIHLSSSNNNILTGNMISYGGISLYDSSSNRLSGNRVSFNNFAVTWDVLSKNNVITDD